MAPLGRTVGSLKGAKTLLRTIGRRFGVEVSVTGVKSIRDINSMLRILEGLVENKGWTIHGIEKLKPLKQIHEKISNANVLSDILRFTAPNFNPADAAPPSSGSALLGAAPSGVRGARTDRGAAPVVPGGDHQRTSHARGARTDLGAASDIPVGGHPHPRGGHVRGARTDLGAASDVPVGDHPHLRGGQVRAADNDRGAAPDVLVGGHPPGGHVRGAANMFNLAEFANRLRDSGVCCAISISAAPMFDIQCFFSASRSTRQGRR